MRNHNFVQDISSWSENTKKLANKTVRKVALDMLTRIVERTPVDTGRARGNWVIGIGNPVMTYDPDLKDKDGGPTVNKGLGELADFDASQGQSIFITNSVPYIVPLEYGHSKQQPEGMVRVTMAEFPGMVKDVTGLRE